jgi:diguanylate cyclase (GGDEF)-like protein
MNLKTFEELKLSGNLPTPAGVGMKILQLTRTEDYSAEEMGEAIMADSSLTGRILKLANTASNSGAEPATTVSGAIMRLGSRTVRDLALAFSLVSERSAGTCKGFDYEKYWSRSLARAVAAQVTTRIIGLCKPEEAYICGLLGEIGRLALASVYSEKYAEILKSDAAATLSSLLEREDADFNINHAQVGACMLADWGLPEAFSGAIEDFCSSKDLADGKDGIQTLAMVLRFSQVIADVCVADETTPNRQWARLGDGLALLRGHLGMETDAFIRFCDTSVSEWGAWGESLDVSTRAESLKFSQVFKRVEEARAAIERGESDKPTTKPGAALERTASEGDAIERFSILAVDDDPVSLRLLTRHLLNDGYLVESARGGKEALKMALQNPPDIVIADWEMPDLDGLELCRALRRTDAGRNMYFLLLTGTTAEELVVEAFDAGCDDFVTKPFIPRLLAARIKGGVRLALLQRMIEADKQTMMRQVAEMGVLTRKLRAASLTDALTELPNRRYAMKRLESEWSSVKRTGRPLSTVMLDIDKFKLVNDDHGHDVGDIVLRQTAAVMKNAIRGSDEVCRIGGEEFLIICRNTDEESCMIVAERVRAAMEAHIVDHPGFERAVTVSAGVACSEQGYDSITALLKGSDEAVYLAKDSGRNQVRRASELAAQKKSA